MASKITSASEVNIGFLSLVSIPNLRQGLLEHFFECSHESEDDSSDSDVCSSIFSDKSSREDSLDIPTKNHTVVKTIYETFHSAAIWATKEYRMTAKKG